MKKHQSTPPPKAKKRPKKARRLTPKAVATRERHRRAVELKAERKTNQQIAEELGYANRGTVSRVIRETVEKADLTAVAKLMNVMAGDLVEIHHARATGRVGKTPSPKHGRLFWQGYLAMARVMGYEAS